MTPVPSGVRGGQHRHGPEGSTCTWRGEMEFRSLVQRRGERLKKKFFFNKSDLLWLMKG